MTETLLFTVTILKWNLKAVADLDSVYLCGSSPLNPAKGLGSVKRECGITIK